MTTIDIIPVPYEEGAYWRKGMKFGPEAVLKHFSQMREYSVRNKNYLDMDSVHISNPLYLSPYDRNQAFNTIQEKVTKTLCQSQVPVLIGGDHSISYPAIKAVSNCFGSRSFGVLHFDAHSDTFGDVDGFRYHHGSMFRTLVEDKLVQEKNIIQFGIRGQVRADSVQYLYSSERTTVSMQELIDNGFDIHSYISDSNIPYYISFDIDFMDPAFAPGTGTPLPGGCTSTQVFEIIDQLKEYKILGIDLVEVAPIYDPSDITSLLAANILHDMLTALNFTASSNNE